MTPTDELIAAPVGEWETTGEERAWLSAFTAEMGHTDDGETFRQATLIFRILRDLTRLTAQVAALKKERDAAHAHAQEWQMRKAMWKECAYKLEAERDAANARAERLAGDVAELRGRAAKAVDHIQRTVDRIANRDDMPYGDRDFRALRGAVRAAVLLLTEPEAKGGDPAPVPATDVEACAAVLVSAINKGGILTLSHDTEYEVRISFRGNRTAAWSAHNAIVAIGIAIQKQRRPGWWDEFIAEARAAGITGKGTSHD